MNVFAGNGVRKFKAFGRFLEKRLPDFLPRTNADFQHVFWKVGKSSEQKMS